MRHPLGSTPIDEKIITLKSVVRPIFILGCGRSGTTIFGTALGKHRNVTYLNEPRKLWSQAYPETDIWVSKASQGKGKMVLVAADVEPEKSAKLIRLFCLEAIKNRSSVLIEKLPINNFRLDFIHQIFPDARFIHIYRNGLEVARSIEKLCERGGWFVRNPYKWDRLTEYEQDKAGSNKLSALCSSYFDKGLLEWRLSTEAAVEFLRDLPGDKYFEFKYDELVEHPVELMSKALEFIDIDDDPDVYQFLIEKITRNTGRMRQYILSEKERLLGGRLLPLSIDAENGLTRFDVYDSK